MPRKPRVTSRALDGRRLQVAERLRHLARITSGPDATFEHQQEIAAAVAAEVLAGLWKDDREPAAAETSERRKGG
jgi:xanthine/CO dehydrogenase XdhC/CoxF family maturation factor